LSYLKLIQFKHIENLLATAQKIEIGAAEHYMEYAEAASKEKPEIAALFHRLAEEERKHEKCVIQLAEEASVDLSKAVALEQHVPSTNSKNTSQANNSLYEILAAAVRREEQAFEIYSQIAASSNNDDVSCYAEKLAKEELGHAALLRAMRRRVYQEDKAKIKIRSLPVPDKLNSVEELLNNAYILETSLATYIENISDSGVDMSSCREHFEFIIHKLADDINRSSNGIDVKELEQSSKNMLSYITTFTLGDLLAECESVYEYYDSFILNAADEEIMNKALFLASQTLTQLILLEEFKE
jgi:rubrerythrin